MKKLVLALSMIAALTASVFAAPYETWSKYRTITVNTTTAGVATTQSNFPLLVRLTDASAATGSDVLADDATGASLRFASSDGETAYDYEIETWTASAAAVWVRVPTVGGNSATGAVVRMYWGKDGASSESSPNNVFQTSNGFRAVYHLNNAPGDSARDATSNNYHMQALSLGAGSVVPQDTIGMIGVAKNFVGGGTNGNAIGGYYRRASADAPRLQWTGDQQFTLSVWVYGDSVQGTALTNRRGILGKYTTATTSTQQYILATIQTPANTATQLRFQGAARNISATGGNFRAVDAAIQQWHHLAYTRTGTATANAVTYLNGVAAFATTGSEGTGATASATPIVIGAYSNPDRFWNGKIDEARFDSTARSADWIKLNYETQKASVTAVALGETQVLDEGEPTVPGAPTGVSGTAGAGQVSVAFTAPGDDGGAAITGYTVTSDPGGFSNTGASSPIVVSGLTNGVGYTFTVVATNSEGDGPASAPSGSVTPRTTPGAPTSVVATPGAGQASVAFDAPASNGGAAITGYTVTSDPGGFTNTGASSPIVVSGLVNGTPYTFTVTAANVAGTGSASSPSDEVTPLSVPGAPTSVTGTAGNGEVSVAFTAPGSNGGTAITGYTVTSDPGGFSNTGASSPIVVSGLANGTPYTFTVVATNSVGDGAASSPSGSVTPFTIPGAPTNVTGTPGSGSVSVAFDAPASNGGSAITNYTVTSNPGDFTNTGASSPIVVSGLSNGTPYTFTVVATNAAGDGAASEPSGSVAPVAAPTVSYAGGPYTFPLGPRITDLRPVKGGGPATSYSIDKDLTALTGLQFNTVTGILSGNPTVSATGEVFEITAHGVGGSTGTTTVTITTTGPTVSYAGGPYSFPLGLAIEALRPAKGSATITSFSIDKNIAALTGLQFNTSTGIISGTPSVVAAGEVFEVTAHGAGGSTGTTTVTITTTGPTVSYTGGPYSFPLGVAITNLRPVKGTAAITGYSIDKDITALTGLQFNTVTGIISGTPTVAAAAEAFEVTAHGAGGSTGTTTVTITTVGPTVSYAGTPYSFPLGVAIEALRPVKGVAAITAYSIDKNIASLTGLQFNTVTGIISGTPSVVAASEAFEVTAHGLGGSTGTTTVTITTVGPTVSYAGTPYSFPLGVKVTEARPVKGAATITGYSIDKNIASLTGLQFNTVTGVISGTPTVAAAAEVFEVTAHGLGGSTGVTNVTVTTAGLAPTVSYADGGVYDFPLGATITNLRPIKGGGPILSYSIDPTDLTAKTGLQFNTSTGILSGTPTVLADEEEFTVTANGWGGTSGTTGVSISTHSTGKMSAGGPLVFRVSGSAMSYAFRVGEGGQGEAVESVTMRIADMSGRTVWSRTVNPSKDGARSIAWDGKAQNGTPAPAGMYIVSVSSKVDGKSSRVVQKTVTLDAN